MMNRVADELLKRVGISKNIPSSTPIGSLSGGERQAVAIARAMHFDSDLIILDEPTNNLGVAETQGVLRFVRNARDSGHSCIFIAHNIHHVFQVVDRIVVMRRGRIVADDIDPKKSSVEGGRAGHYRHVGRRGARRGFLREGGDAMLMQTVNGQDESHRLQHRQELRIVDGDGRPGAQQPCRRQRGQSPTRHGSGQAARLSADDRRGHVAVAAGQSRVLPADRQERLHDRSRQAYRGLCGPPAAGRVMQDPRSQGHLSERVADGGRQAVAAARTALA